jgi:TPR repeat protein
VEKKLKADYDVCDALLCKGESRNDFIAKNIKRIGIWKAAAESGDPAGQLLYGHCFFYGHGEKEDEETAIQWVIKSAEQGSSQAQCLLGLCYHHGWGVIENYKKAVAWCTKSAEQGHVRAQRLLADYYYYGDGIRKNLKKAFEFYIAAGEQGEAVGLEVLGISCFGKYNESDITMRWSRLGKLDLDKAFYYFQKAAEVESERLPSYRLGFFSWGGSFYLAKCYRYGLGTEKNYEKADEWEQISHEFRERREWDD